MCCSRLCTVLALLAAACAVAAGEMYVVASDRVLIGLNRTADGHLGLGLLRLRVNASADFGLSLLLPWTADSDPSEVSGTAMLLLSSGSPPPPPRASSSPGAALEPQATLPLSSAEARWVGPVATVNTTVQAANTSHGGSIQLCNATVGNGVASESWNITVAGSRLTFMIERTYHRAVRIVGDRVPAFVLRTVGSGESPLAGAQVPSVLDLDMRTNGSRGFALPAGGSARRWYEVLSEAGGGRVLDVVLAPSRLTLRSTMGGDAVDNATLFSMARPPSDGTTVIALGREGVGRLGPAVGADGAVARAAGETHRFTWELDLLGPDVAAPTAPFVLELGTAEAPRAAAAGALARQYNMWLGWIYGNNPASVPCLHEMGFFPAHQRPLCAKRWRYAQRSHGKTAAVFCRR